MAAVRRLERRAEAQPATQPGPPSPRRLRSRRPTQPFTLAVVGEKPVPAVSYERPLPRKDKPGGKGKGKGKAREDATADDSMGSGLSWRKKEDDALADSVLAVRRSNITGTDQSGPEM